jgi:hypothetical protein
MSKTNGEGRSSAEKAGRVIDTEAYAKRKRKKQEDDAWAARSGPVEVRKIGG